MLFPRPQSALLKLDFSFSYLLFKSNKSSIFKFPPPALLSFYVCSIIKYLFTLIQFAGFIRNILLLIDVITVIVSHPLCDNNSAPKTFHLYKTVYSFNKSSFSDASSLTTSYNRNYADLQKIFLY
jgi:hypothetical protein